MASFQCSDFSEHYTPVFFSPSHHRLFFFFGQIKSFYQNCKTALIPLNSSHPERTVKNRSMCAETSALATPALVLTLLFSFHTTETLVLCPFKISEVMPHHRRRGVRAEKRATCCHSPFLSPGTKQVSWILSKGFACLQNEIIGDSYSLCPKSRKIWRTRVLFRVRLQYIASSILSSLSPPKSSPLSKYDMM